MSNVTNQSNKLTKTAVDSNAERYWQEFFSSGGTQYGSLLTRKNLPKRLKAALTAELTLKARKASQNDALPQVLFKEADFAPLAHGQSEDGTVILEGVFRGQLENGARVARLWKASFKDEKLTGFRSVESP